MHAVIDVSQFHSTEVPNKSNPSHTINECMSSRNKRFDSKPMMDSEERGFYYTQSSGGPSRIINSKHHTKNL